MNRTHLRDFQQSVTLRPVEVSLELQGPLDPIEPTRFRLALRAIHCVNPEMLQSNCYFFQHPLLSSRVQRNRHGCSTAQRRQQKIVRRRAGISSAVRNRFVSSETMAAGEDLLREATAGSSNYDFRFVRHGVDGHCLITCNR